jgi:hypothetical protein
MRDHPSGLPIRRREVKRAYSIERAPREEFLTPRLRHRELVEAIGFVTHFDHAEEPDLTGE